MKRLLRLSWKYRAGCLQVLGLQFVQLALGLGALGFTGLGTDIIQAAADPTKPLADQWRGFGQGHRRVGAATKPDGFAAEFFVYRNHNIRFPRPASGQAEVRAAVEAIGCGDLFENLPHGLHTEAGERGSGLSLGQRQLVCFCAGAAG